MANSVGERQPGDRNSLCGLISAIQIAGDIEYQRRIWIRDEGPDRSTFREIVAQIFDDYRIDEMAGDLGSSLGLSEAQRDLLRDFDRSLDRYVDARHMYDDERIVEDPEWHLVAAAARDVVSHFTPWYEANCRGRNGF